jgi:hypothetical protein
VRQELPHEASFAALFGPQRGRAFLAEAAEHPLDASATDFSPVNAWWLAEASLLAYVPEPAFVREAWERAGMSEVAFFSEKSTHGFAAGDGDACIVAFRGTDVHQPENLKTDLRFLLAPESAGRVHQGFREALEHIWPPLSAHLRDRACWFTGHSLGAALATLAAARHERVRGLYTFGSPRVGDAAFGASLAFPIFRVVNNNDLVTRLPPPLGYTHVGALRYFDAERRLRHEPKWWDRVREQMAGHGARVAENIRRWLSGDFKAIAYDPLVDHSPVHYAIHCWNHYLETRRPPA